MSEITVNRIKELAKRKGVTIAKVERACDFSNGYIMKRVNGDFPAGKLMTIADYFGVDVLYLMGAENIKMPLPITKSIGDKIADIMKRKRVSKAEVAVGVGIPINKLDEMIEGKDRNFDILLMYRFCEFFDVNYCYFVEDVNDGANLGTNIKALAGFNGETPEDIAKGTRLPVATINDAIANKNTVKFSELTAIAEHFGYKFSDMISKDFTEYETPDDINRVYMHKICAQWLEHTSKVMTREQIQEISDFAEFILSKK